MPALNRLEWSDRDAREVLARYEPIVQATARRLWRLASDGHALDHDDLCAEGRVAVLEAIDTYQNFGIDQAAWVRTRVRQRMIDTIRKFDLRTRGETRLAMRHASGEAATAHEDERGRAIAARRLVSLDTTETPQGEPLGSCLRDSTFPPIEAVVHARLRDHRVRTLLASIPPRERAALEPTLFEGQSQREIAEAMGLSESRICQLQRRAVERLRELLAARETAADVAA